MDQVERKMQDLLMATPLWGWLVLQELFKQARILGSMPESMVWAMLQGTGQ
jgi:hypothetical protein